MALEVDSVQILRRRRSRRVDMFLDWLQHGAFAALKAGDVKSLQIYIHADPQYRGRVFETYTFNIKYLSQRSGDGGERLAGIEVNGQDSARDQGLGAHVHVRGGDGGHGQDAGGVRARRQVYARVQELDGGSVRRPDRDHEHGPLPV
ncbi:hypothetical protein LTR37_008956 [Vermiconidia calcicola]|uniref:Uncharacterized protein n=1 Tax=Vermiconidia calcicola TaxID=1690605 RepID=A0ACC3N939_9PEZI|nr:hypothetical protein LTR37_008956 [Vermiconidia calcicola]